MMIRIRDAVVSFVVGVSLLEVRRREISASSSQWLRHPSPSLTNGDIEECRFKCTRYVQGALYGILCTMKKLSLSLHAAQVKCGRLSLFNSLPYLGTQEAHYKSNLQTVST